MIDAKEFFRRAITQATAEIEQVEPANFSLPTPDTEWDVETLAGHMLYELSWTFDLLQGKTIAEVGSMYEGDLIRGDLQRNWHEASARAMAVLNSCNLKTTVHVSYGNITAEAYIKQAGSDQLIHAWDLGMALAKEVNFVPEVAQYAYDYALPRKGEMQDSGLFADPIPVSEDADIQTKLLALYGRSGTNLKF